MTNTHLSEPMYRLADGIEKLTCYEYPEYTVNLIVFTEGPAKLQICYNDNTPDEIYDITNITEIGEQCIVTGPGIEATLN
jgi:hypothetical protein